MKKTALLFIFALTFISFSFGQRYPNKSEVYLNIGVNTVANIGTQSPVEGIDEWAFENPFVFGFEYKWNDLFGVEQSFSFNKFSRNSNIDNSKIDEELSYFAADTHLKYYFGEYFIESDDLDLFAAGGLGLFSLNKVNGSFNFGGGVTYWFSDTFAISGQGVGKFAFDNSNRIYDTNHFQYTLKAIFIL